MRLRWNEFFFLPKHVRVMGIVLFGFVFLNPRAKQMNPLRFKELLTHERIHIRQQLELLFFPFFLLYAFEWLFLLWKYKDKDLAYRNISFEKEAYEHENKVNYIQQRKAYCWLNYWKKNN